MHHYECIALCKHIVVQRGRFCPRSLASVSQDPVKTGHHECSSSKFCAAAQVVTSSSLEEVRRWLDPFGQVDRSCWHCYIVIRVWQTCFQLLCTICLQQVTAVHPISQQFQLNQILSKNPSVCSSLISTVLLPPSDHPRLRFKPCA